MKRSFALTEAGAVGRRPRRAFEDFLAEDLDGRAIPKDLQKREVALPDRCTEVLYHTSVLAGDRLGRWRVSRIFGALLALSCQLRGVRARRPRSQGDIQKSRMHPSPWPICKSGLYRFTSAEIDRHHGGHADIAAAEVMNLEARWGYGDLIRPTHRLGSVHHPLQGRDDMLVIRRHLFVGLIIERAAEGPSPGIDRVAEPIGLPGDHADAGGDTIFDPIDFLGEGVDIVDCHRSCFRVKPDLFESSSNTRSDYERDRNDNYQLGDESVF